MGGVVIQESFLEKVTFGSHLEKELGIVKAGE